MLAELNLLKPWLISEMGTWTRWMKSEASSVDKSCNSGAACTLTLTIVSRFLISPLDRAWLSLWWELRCRTSWMKQPWAIAIWLLTQVHWWNHFDHPGWWPKYGARQGVPLVVFLVHALGLDNAIYFWIIAWVESESLGVVLVVALPGIQMVLFGNYCSVPGQWPLGFLRIPSCPLYGLISAWNYPEGFHGIEVECHRLTGKVHLYEQFSWI